MAEVRLIVLYPVPIDTEQFDREYQRHLEVLHGKMQIPKDARPYSVTRFVETPQGTPAYYQMFTMPFPSAEALQRAMSTPEMQEVAADAARISTGGEPVILVGAAESWEQRC